MVERAQTSDGQELKLRSSVCAACGYSLAGAVLRDGGITCPECGETLGLRRPKRPKWLGPASVVKWTVRVLVALIIAMAIASFAVDLLVR
ncbi:MAG: hypothetical protein AAF747_10430 [Planctomycetota bacterium]